MLGEWAAALDPVRAPGWPGGRGWPGRRGPRRPASRPIGPGWPRSPTRLPQPRLRQAYEEVLAATGAHASSHDVVVTLTVDVARAARRPGQRTGRAKAPRAVPRPGRPCCANWPFSPSASPVRASTPRPRSAAPSWPGSCASVSTRAVSADSTSGAAVWATSPVWWRRPTPARCTASSAAPSGAPTPRCTGPWWSPNGPGPRSGPTGWGPSSSTSTASAWSA